MKFIKDKNDLKTWVYFWLAVFLILLIFFITMICAIKHIEKSQQEWNKEIKGEKMNIKIIVWNLKMVEKNLYKEGKTNDAYTVRLALDLLSSNWRRAKNSENILLKTEIDPLFK